MGRTAKGGFAGHVVDVTAASVAVASSACLAGIVAGLVTVQLVMATGPALAVDYVHDDDVAAAVVAALPGDFHAGYPYHFTDPAYFASRDWHSTSWHGDERNGLPCANEDGTLGEYREHWYVAHFDTGYGQEILDMKVGDEVSVDGVAYRVEGTMLIHAGEGYTVSELLDRVDDADVVLQTCTEDGYEADGSKRMVAVWGRLSG